MMNKSICILVNDFTDVCGFNLDRYKSQNVLFNTKTSSHDEYKYVMTFGFC